VPGTRCAWRVSSPISRDSCVGAIVLGVVVTKDPLSVGRVAALALIVGGVVLARVTS
jgi:multidrug transporter EmrE-like cation transporter